MNSNRNVLRPTHNRLPLQDVSSTKTLINNKPKLCTNASFQQQENYLRPILTATRSIKKFLKETNHNDDDDGENQMLISPIQKQTVFEQTTKTREQLEQDLFEL
jgi:hypothetical protein